jgi:hypothetical protein
VLGPNPLTVKPMAIKDIKVVETIKDGKTICNAGGDADRVEHSATCESRY